MFDAAGVYRYRNYLNRQTFVGGEGRLRGYPSSYLTGKDWFASNIEFRSRPVELFSIQLGGAGLLRCRVALQTGSTSCIRATRQGWDFAYSFRSSIASCFEATSGFRSRTG